jgi:hypothetical protein
MQHKIRKAMSDRDQHYRLSGLVEVDEGYVGVPKRQVFVAGVTMWVVRSMARGGAGAAHAACEPNPWWPLRWSIAALASRAKNRYRDLPL